MVQISVVTPTLNEPRLVRAIGSIRAQSIADELEVVVVDGGSSPSYLATLQRLAPQIDELVPGPDRGIYDGMNKGIRASSGDAIAILNADDAFADKHYLERARDAISKGAPAVYGDIRFVSPAGRVVREWRAGAYGRWQWRLGWMPPHPSLVVARSVYEKCGTFRTEFGLAADYEFMLRAFFLQRQEPRYLPGCAVEMATGGASNTTWKNIARGWSEVREAWRSNGLTGGLLAATLKPARKIRQLRRGFRDR